MRTEFDTPVRYTLPIGIDNIELNQYINKNIRLKWTGNIYCIVCGRKTKKSFFQGLCYPCFRDAPQASECIIHPEKCRGHLQEGRDIEWEEKNHVKPHYVYLALSSQVKVGVTREDQI
ncbi:MAG: DUF2797 domain-containing protein, partial [Flavobacteriales bacterium]